MAELYRKLEKYSNMDYYPFHMPGHKRNGEAADGALAESYGLDITEIDGFDNLHQAQGILREEQEKAAGLYGSAKSYYLVNGSTCGILSAIFAVTRKGDRLLMARNCHKAVYHAAYLRELETVYLQPELLTGRDGLSFGIAGMIEPETVEKALKENPDCAAVMITSPTYEGVISDVKKIVDIVHSYGVPLIVDEAHGAHLGFHEEYPVSSVRLGADLVIHSVHKTLPAMTQAALLHWNENGNLSDRRKVERYLRIFQTSSPSYVLMASISSCMEIVEREGRERLDRLLKYRREFIERIRACRYVRIFEGERKRESFSVQCDPCKLVIGIAGGRKTGQELYDILLGKYHLQMEMAAADYVLAIVTMMDTQEGWKRLADALVEIDDEIRKSENVENRLGSERWIDDRKFPWCYVKQIKPEVVMTLAEAYDAQQEVVRLTDSKGRIAAEYINLYPPGIPLAAPGERLTEEIVGALLYYDRLRLKIQGVENGFVRVIEL